MSPQPITENTQFYGDNLFVLREHTSGEGIDFIYFDLLLTLVAATTSFLKELAIQADRA